MTTRFFLGAKAAEVQGCVWTQAFAFGQKPHQLLLDKFPKGPLQHQERRLHGRNISVMIDEW